MSLNNHVCEQNVFDMFCECWDDTFHWYACECFLLGGLPHLFVYILNYH